jgi:hypothetical protein
MLLATGFLSAEFGQRLDRTIKLHELQIARRGLLLQLLPLRLDLLPLQVERDTALMRVRESFL